MPKKIMLTPWLNNSEFKHARDLLFQEDPDGRKRGISTLKSWKSRSRKLPVAIDCTRDLTEIQLKFSELQDDNFKMSCTMALTRLVNLHTEELQRFGRGLPVHELAEKIGLPKWIVDIRHRGTHGHMPELSVLEGALTFCLAWLKERFWDPHVKQMEESTEKSPEEFDVKIKDKINKVILAYMECMVTQNAVLNGKPRQSLEDVLRPLNKPMRGKASRNYVAYLLSQDGYLVPTIEQEEALGINSDDLKRDDTLPPALRAFWTPFLDHFQDAYHPLEPIVVKSIADQLAKIARRPDGSADATVSGYLMGWAKELIKRDGTPSASAITDTGSPPEKRRKRLVSWNQTVEACIKKPNKHSLELLPSLMPLADDPPLSATKRKKILGAVALMVKGPNGLPPPPNGLLSLEKMERALELDAAKIRRGGQNDGPLEVLMEEEEEEGSEARQGPADGATGGNVDPWSICGDSVDWRKIPLGVLPGQQLDPAAFQLSVPLTSKRKRKRSSSDAND